MDSSVSEDTGMCVRQMSKANGKQLRRFWDENPNCHWCGVLTIIMPQHLKKHGPVPDNAATIDHLFSRLDPRRFRSHMTMERRHVLACRKCNNQRGAEDQQKNIDLVRLKCKSFPIGEAVIRLAEAVEQALREGRPITL